jgi:hypothetical protein
MLVIDMINSNHARAHPTIRVRHSDEGRNPEKSANSAPAFAGATGYWTYPPFFIAVTGNQPALFPALVVLTRMPSSDDGMESRHGDDEQEVAGEARGGAVAGAAGVSLPSPLSAFSMIVPAAIVTSCPAISAA